MLKDNAWMESVWGGVKKNKKSKNKKKKRKKEEKEHGDNTRS